MKKRNLVLIALLAIVIINMCMASPAISAENGVTSRKFNVVFVVDASSSMSSSDSQGWRFEAIDQFLSLLSMKGNYVGTVVFNGKVLNFDGVSAITSKNDKKAASDSMRNAVLVGYTNIGAALEKANDLIKKGDSNLPSIILLLSDGNTQMPSNEELERSLEAQNNAIAEAQNNDTQIYCVGLNANGKIRQEELANIADQTNGVFQIISKADDLKDVFREFYKLIYGTGGIEIQNVELPTVNDFTVPKIGVEEVNILIDGQPSSIKLTQPSGIEVSNNDLNSMISKGNNFTNIKIENPLSGAWKLELDGQPGQTVTINFILNLNVTLQTQLTPKNETESYKRGESLTLGTKIILDGKEVTDNSVYQEYPIALTVAKANDINNIQTVSTNAIDGICKADLKFNENGTYYVTASIDIGYGKITGNTVSINIENIVPKPNEEKFDFKEYCLNFGKKQFTYNFDEMVTDGDGENISYAIDKYTFADDEFSIDDSVLTITPKSAEEGYFNIIATDESGAACEFKINIVYKSLLKSLLLIIALILVVGFALFFLIRYMTTHKPFKGSVTVTAFDGENGITSAPMTEWPAKKPINIELINGDANEIGGIKGSLFGSGKDYVNFSVKGIAYCNSKKVKKIKIFDGCSETVTQREDGVKGVEITFTKQDGEF